MVSQVMSSDGLPDLEFVWVKSSLYGSIGLVRREKQHGVTLLWWYLLLIHRFREEISRSDLNWLNMAVILLKALFGLR